MKIIYSSEKPELKTSPDHYFGIPNVVTFAYKNGELLHADKKNKVSLVFLNGKPFMQFDAAAYHMTHRNLIEIYNRATKSKEDKETWLRGRTNPARTKLNLWGNPSEDEMAGLLYYLKRFKVLTPKEEYTVGVASRQGSKVYEIAPAETVDIQIKPHAELRKHIYRTLGIESKLSRMLNLLREELFFFTKK